MIWIKFPDGSRYTLAADIQKFAERNGYTVPCEVDGTRHPGTDCNQKMRTVVKDAGLRSTFRINDQSVVDIRAKDGFLNRLFIENLVHDGIVSSAYLRMGMIQLYSIESVNAILSVMLNRHVEYQLDVDDLEWESSYLPVKRAHNFGKLKHKPKASLFKK